MFKTTNLFLIAFFIFTGCSENNIYEDLAIQKSKEMNCKEDVELLVQNDKTELWASYSKNEEGLLCVFICKNNNCAYSTERD